MKRIFPVALLFVFCVFMLLSCSLSATQIEQNLKDNDYVTTKWTEDKIELEFSTLSKSEDYTITAVIEGSKGSHTVLTVQLKSLAEANAFKDDLGSLIVNDLIEIEVEGRLVIVGQAQDISAALGKVSKDTDSSSN